MNVLILDSAPRSSNTFMCRAASFWDHGPPVDLAWDSAPQPPVDPFAASVERSRSSGEIVIGFPLSISRFFYPPC